MCSSLNLLFENNKNASKAWKIKRSIPEINLDPTSSPFLRKIVFAGVYTTSYSHWYFFISKLPNEQPGKS